MSEPNNPYTAPQSTIVDLTAPAVKMPIPATRMRRFSNYLLDTFFQIVLAIIIITPTMLVLGEDALNGIPDFLIGSLVLLIYYLFFESLFAWTPAKLITGTRVVNKQGLKPTFGQIAGRSFIRIIPFEVFSFLGSTGRGWHDSWSETYVVYIRS